MVCAVEVNVMAIAEIKRKILFINGILLLKYTILNHSDTLR